ncbi:MAG: LysM peptidoglycan-binding domain-containing protein [Melioribacteraceae bacterium]|nr:LysM peptidoglycan-binding domain-containing protein [Melioribacteraceae bacterium]
MKYKFLAVLSLLLISSCSVFENFSNNTPSIQQDSVAVIETSVIVNNFLEDARQCYVLALNHKNKGNIDEALNNFDEALSYINRLSYFTGIDENVSYIELEGAIVEDYQDFIDTLEELPENASNFALEKWMDKNIPEIQIDNEEEISEETDSSDVIVVGDFKLEINRHVERYIEAYTGKYRKTMRNWLSRSGKYFPMMAKIFAEENVPQQLIFLSMPESGLNPHARSWARAVGLWQFIKSTGRYYDLKTDFYIDERRDPEKATRAAAQHLRDLYTTYGSWYNALATYNCSPARVKRSMRYAGSNDFWKYRRYLPRETRNYVPQYIAVTLIATQLEKYGFADIKYEKPYEYKIHKINEGIDLNVLAKCAGISYNTLKDMNPEIIQHHTPRNYAGGYPLKVPAKNYDAFVENLESIPAEAKLQYVIHTVRKGETLSGIAQKYKVQLSNLAKFNNISLRTKIHPKRELKIPTSNFKNINFELSTDIIAASEDENYTTEAPYQFKLTTETDDTELLKIYREQSGENTEVIIPEGKIAVDYKVKRFDKLVDIAQMFDVRTSDLRNWNGLPYTSYVKIGQVLKIYVEEEKKEYYATIDELSRGDKLKILYASSEGSWITHKIRSGETLGHIAMKYGVRVSQLKKWNNLNTSRIYKGKKIRIFAGSGSGLAASGSESTSSDVPANGKYKVRSGDSLEKIAKKFGTTISNLKELNNLTSNKIIAGKTLAVTNKTKSVASADNSANSNAFKYKIKRGDTISEIAENYKVSTKNLRAWNNLKGNNIVVGKTLTIYSNIEEDTNVENNSPRNEVVKADTKVETTDADEISYTVKKNDTLGHIAELYNIRARDIRRWNGIRGSNIKVGQRLKIYPNKKSSNNTITADVKIHRVQSGDSLILIAKKYKVRVSEIKEWNDLKSNKIRIGQKIRILKNQI